MNCSWCVFEGGFKEGHWKLDESLNITGANSIRASA